MTTIPITIASDQRVDGRDAEFNHTFVQNVVAPTGRVRLKSVWFINTFKNVTSKTNSLDVMEYDAGGLNPLPVSITIPEGNYTLTTLSTALKTALEAESIASGYSLTYTISQNPLNKHLVITVGANSIEVLQTGTLNLRLGFRRSATSNKAASVEAPRILNLLSPPYIYIVSDIGAVKAVNNAINYQPNIIGIVPVDVAFGEAKSYEFKIPYVLRTQERLSNSSFQAVFEDFTPCDFDGGRIIYQLELL